MTHRLLINPGTPQSWEIQLKPGVNRIGRVEGNDHVIEHASVSGSHCEIIVNDASVLLKDLGSTNGTFVNRSPVQEVSLQSGQHVQLGNVDMVFESVGAASSQSAGRISIPSSQPRLSISRPHVTAIQSQPVVENTRAVEELQEPPGAPPVPAPRSAPGAVCKSHPKSPARYTCQKCRQYFCELCVTTRTTSGGAGKFCRKCGASVVPLKVQAARVEKKSFFAQIPSAFVYPFKGTGAAILIASAIVFSLLDAVKGIFTIFLAIMAVGYLFSYMQNLIYATAAEETQMPDLPAMDDLFSSAFRLVATVVISFVLPLALVGARFVWEESSLTTAIIPATILSCLYFPMAFLAVAMKDTVLAANPLIVIPAILKIPGQYLVAAILLIGVYGIRMFGNSVSGDVASHGLISSSMGELFLSFGFRALWSLMSIYLLTVSMRILGLLYVTNKQKLGWFSH